MDFSMCVCLTASVVDSRARDIFIKACGLEYRCDLVIVDSKTRSRQPTIDPALLLMRFFKRYLRYETHRGVIYRIQHVQGLQLVMCHVRYIIGRSSRLSTLLYVLSFSADLISHPFKALGYVRT